jgi:site-specific recombinase XerD
MSQVDVWLESAVGDYLSWMRQAGYAPSTIYTTQRLLRHFKAFIRERGVSRQDLFTHDSLKAFESACPRFFAACAVRGLARHLFRRKQIPAPIIRPRVLLPDVYEAYLRFFEENRQIHPLTLTSTRRVLSALHDYLSQRDIALSGLRIEHIDDFLSRFNAALAWATCRKNRSYLRGFLRYLYHNRGLLPRDLSKLVLGAVNFAHANPPTFLRAREIKQLFAVSKTYSAWELRCLAMTHLAYALGLRPKEIARLSLDDILFKKGQLRVADRKSCNPLMLPLPEAAIKAISAYLVAARPQTGSRSLFLTLLPAHRPVAAATVGGDITRLIRKIHPTATAYWLRHTYAQTLLESQASIFEVKQMLGHDSLNSTRKYLHIHVSLMRKALFDETL